MCFTIFLDFKFTLIAEGKDCNRLDNIKECKNGAKSLRLPDTFADRFYDSRYPPFCYYKYVTDKAGKEGLKFNTAANSSIPCSPLRPCICQVASKYKQGKVYCLLKRNNLTKVVKLFGVGKISVIN